jgi:N-sulfoglucosamine sulfohydrolase
LFDLAADPDCVVNLAGDASTTERKTALREKLYAALREQGDPRMARRGELFDRYPSVKPLSAAKKP